MSKIIRVTCSSCAADCQLSPSAFHLTIFDAGESHYYEFFCPHCFDLCRKQAPADVQGLLLSASVEMDMVHVPEEVLEVKTGPALTVDDLMDFCIALKRRSDIAYRANEESIRADSNRQPTA